MKPTNEEAEEQSASEFRSATTDAPRIQATCSSISSLSFYKIYVALKAQFFLSCLKFQIHIDTNFINRKPFVNTHTITSKYPACTIPEPETNYYGDTFLAFTFFGTATAASAQFELHDIKLKC